MMLPDLIPEPHAGSAHAQLNWLRASVLGANDGIVSIAALLVGVAGATEALGQIVITGVAGVLAGALSMAVGEYVSVSSQRDTEERLLAKERHELTQYPDVELRELADIYERKGLSKGTATLVAKELTDHDVFIAHAEAELGIHPEKLTNPWHAAFASGASFVAGAFIPLFAITLPPSGVRIPVTFGAVCVALVITGVLSARVSDASMLKVTWRVLVGGVLAMTITFGIGRLFGVAVA